MGGPGPAPSGVRSAWVLCPGCRTDPLSCWNPENLRSLWKATGRDMWPLGGTVPPRMAGSLGSHPPPTSALGTGVPCPLQVPLVGVLRNWTVTSQWKGACVLAAGSAPSWPLVSEGALTLPSCCATALPRPLPGTLWGLGRDKTRMALTGSALGPPLRAPWPLHCSFPPEQEAELVPAVPRQVLP